jgi:HPt (histidine-containing phosphotransfer) domain-containing protein
MSGPAIDDVAFAELQASAGAEFVDGLVDTFLAEAPRMLAELRAAAEGANAEAFRRAAHSLKSNASTFGAAPLAAMARELELGGLAAAGQGSPLAALAAEYARAAARLAELRGG